MQDGKPPADFKCQTCGAEFVFTNFAGPVCLNCGSTYLTFRLRKTGATSRSDVESDPE